MSYKYPEDQSGTSMTPEDWRPQMIRLLNILIHPETHEGCTWATLLFYPFGHSPSPDVRQDIEIILHRVDGQKRSTVSQWWDTWPNASHTFAQLWGIEPGRDTQKTLVFQATDEVHLPVHVLPTEEALSNESR
jgi:hypothetical protein